MILRAGKTITHADTLIASILDQLDTDTNTRKSRAILARMNRTYSHAIIDGAEFILVPAQQSPTSIIEAA